MEQVKLGDFISQTIIEIIDGVAKAQEYAKDADAAVNPRNVNWSETKKSYHVVTSGVTLEDSAPHVSSIDFDVLLNVGESDRAQGAIGVFAAAFGVGVKEEAEETIGSAHRIKFQLLAKLPQQP